MGKLSAAVNCLICFFLAAFASAVNGAEETDSLDVTDGENPTLRYGFYTSLDGTVHEGRYYFIDDGETLKVTMANYGQAPVELPVQAFDREAGLLELGWEGFPGRECTLQRYDPGLFLGNCIEDELVLPIAIRVSSNFDADMKGRSFPMSETDVAILKRAIEIMQQQGSRNPEDDRICADDVETGRYSIFCALYQASIETAGVYRHHRAALAGARLRLLAKYPGEYTHILTAINNNPDIPDEDIITELRLLLERYARRIALQPG